MESSRRREMSSHYLDAVCNTTRIVEGTPYGCFLLHDDGIVTAFTIFITTLYSILALWSLWELSFQCYRANTVCASLFSQTTWICVMTFFNGFFFVIFYIVKKYAYDDRVTYEVMRGMSDICQFTLALFVCNAWIDMATSLAKYSTIGIQELKFSYFHKFLQHCGYINIFYCLFRIIEIAFRIPEPQGFGNIYGIATACRMVALGLYGVLMISIVSVTISTYSKLKGLVAKRKAGDLLKRKVVSILFF